MTNIHLNMISLNLLVALSRSTATSASNFRAYTYIRSMGPDGLKAVTENAVLNANYMMRDSSLISTCRTRNIVSMSLYYPVVAKRNWVYVRWIWRKDYLTSVSIRLQSTSR